MTFLRSFSALNAKASDTQLNTAALQVIPVDTAPVNTKPETVSTKMTTPLPSVQTVAEQTKFGKQVTTTHAATFPTCPRVIKMLQRANDMTEYGC